MIQPKHAEKESEIADARSNKGFLRRGGGARTFDPEADQQIRSESNQFPANEKQEQAVCDDHSEHCAGKERKISEKAGEVFIARHVADAENKNAKADQCDHDQHAGGERIKHPAEAKCLVTKGEPGEILNSAEARSLQRRQKRQDRECERNGLTDDRKTSSGSPA